MRAYTAPIINVVYDAMGEHLKYSVYDRHQASDAVRFYGMSRGIRGARRPTSCPNSAAPPSMMRGSRVAAIAAIMRFARRTTFGKLTFILEQEGQKRAKAMSELLLGYEATSMQNGRSPTR